MPRRRGQRISRNPTPVRIQVLPEPFKTNVANRVYTYTEALGMIINELSANRPELAIKVSEGRMTYKDAYEQMEAERR